MPTLVYNQPDHFTVDIATKQHDFINDTIKIGLTNAPTVNAAGLYDEIPAQNGYPAGGPVVNTAGTTGQSGKNFVLQASQDISIQAAGGDIGPFDKAFLYNAISGKLIGTYNFGAPTTISSGATLLISSANAFFVLV